MPENKQNKDSSVMTVRVTLPMKKRIDGKLVDEGMTIQARLHSLLVQWLDEGLSERPPSTPPAPPANLIRSLATIAAKSAEVTRAIEELQHGTTEGNLHDRATTAAQEGHRIADRLGGGTRGGGKAG